MKVLKSIQWRLQLWYGLVLVGVLASLGVTAYRLQRDLQLRRVDDELQRHFAFVTQSLHPPRGPEGGDDPFGPPDGGPPEEPPPRDERFAVPASITQFFDSDSDNHFFYIVQGDDGGEMARSTNAPNSQWLGRWSSSAARFAAPPPQGRPRPPAPHTLDGFRLVAGKTPRGLTMIVGIPLAPIASELNRTALVLTAASAVILFLGLTGGWWIARRAIAPIASISGTAATIAAGNLAQRINVTDTESELGQLAGVLNSTFARLESAFAQQQQFTSNAAHELRTPVTVILTHTQTALQRERDAPEYRLALEACHRAAQRMRRLITSLLELARLDAGRDVFRPGPVDFGKIARECVEMVRPLASQRGIKITTQLASVELKGDPDRLGRVVTNLLTNAIQYNREGGEVRIELETRDRVAVLTVNDTGVGIGPADLPHIFERFYRADPSRAGDSGHAGLGLAICKSIIDSHNGKIEVASVLGKGATLTVRLPLEPAKPTE